MTEVGIDGLCKIHDELITVLATTDEEEFIKMEEIKRKQKRISDLLHAKQEDIKDCIIEFTKEADVHSELVSKCEAEVQAESKMAQKQAEIESLQQHKQSIEKQVEDLQKKKEDLEAEQASLEAERERIENSTTKILPAMRYDVKLYHKITGIRWQYDCPEHEVKGLIASKKKVETFDLNKHQNSQFFIVNHLWDLIESTQGQ